MEWNQLESDPGLFTLLLEDFNVKNVQVEEVYDLTTPLEGDVFGLIFLFKWQENGKKSLRRNPRSSITLDPEIFFAYQVTPNSCATHALLSILLNQNSIEPGIRLREFKEATKNLPPRVLGLTMGHYSFLYEAHNKHAAFYGKIQLDESLQHKIYDDIEMAIEQARILDANSNDSPSKTASSDFSKVTYSIKPDEDSFHFVCFLPIKGQLYELDGLKPEPICHGKISDEKLWTKDCFDLLQNRVKDQKDQRYNLMALVPDSIKLINEKIKKLNANRSIVNLSLKKLDNEDASSNVNTLVASANNKRITRKTATDQTLAVDIPEEVETESNHSASNSSKRMTTRSSRRKCSFESSVTPNILSDNCTTNVQDDQTNNCENNLLYSKETLTDQVTSFSKIDLTLLLSKIDGLQKRLEKSLFEQIQRKRQFILEDARRVHNYTPFITEFLKCLNEEQPEVFEDFARSVLDQSPNSNGSSSGSSLNGGPVNQRKSSLTTPNTKKRRKPSNSKIGPLNTDKRRIEIHID